MENSPVRVHYANTQGGTRERSLIQYVDRGNLKAPTSKTVETLGAGVYRIEQSMSGVCFEKHEFATDELLRFNGCGYDEVMEEVEKFWELGTDFEKFGFTHTHGILLTGKPGMGKSCLIKLLMESIVSHGDVVFSVRSTHTLVEGVKAFREVEPDRKAFVVLEDVDDMIAYASAEHALLELMDGDAQVNKLLFIATSNYPDRLPERMTRVGRFGRTFEVVAPSAEGRRLYLTHKLGKYETVDNINRIVAATEGLGFNHLKNLILSVYCFKREMKGTVERLRKSAGLPNLTDSYIELKIKEAFLGLNEYMSSVDAVAAVPIADRMHKSLVKRLSKLGFDGVAVDSVVVDADGDARVVFSDIYGGKQEVLFGADGSSIVALILGKSDDEEADDVISVDLSPLAPSVMQNEFGTVSVDLVNPLWMNKSAFDTIFSAGEIVAQMRGQEAEEDPEMDAHGNIIVQYKEETFAGYPQYDETLLVEMAIHRVVRGGKGMRIPILRCEHRSKISGYFRVALTKMAKESRSTYLTYRKPAAPKVK